MSQNVLLDKNIIEKLAVFKFKTRKIIQEISKNQVNNENIAKLSILSSFVRKPFYIYSGSKELNKYIFICMNNIFIDGKPFELNIDKDTTIEDVLGPVNEELISTGKYVRKIIGFLPSSDVCLLTNALEGNKYIKNTILDVMLQNIYMNNGSLVHLDLPLKIITGKFNRPNDELSKHIWNSMFLKYYINSTSDAIDVKRGTVEDNINYHINLKDIDKFKLEDIDMVLSIANLITFDDSSTRFIEKLKEKITEFNDARNDSKQYGIDQISNSKQIWNDINLALKVSAVLNGRIEVDITDCFVIEHILWNQPIHSNVVSKFINEVSSDFEYGFYNQYDIIKNKYNDLTKFIKSRILNDLKYKKDIQKKIFINNIGKYYYFTSENYEHNLFIDINDIDLINKSEGLVNALNLSIKIYSKEDFINNQYNNKRLFLNFDGKNYYIYKNNNINDTKINIIPDLIEINSNKIEKINIDEKLLEDVNEWMKSLIFDLYYDIRELNELLNKDFSQLTKVNVFICDRKMDFYKKSIRDTLNKLNRIRESIQMISTNLKLSYKGMYNSSVELFTPELGF